MKRVALYYNLHKECWSVQSREKPDYGKVIAHVDEALLFDAKYVVRQTGRNKVLKEGRKNVHAFVVGTWIPFEIISSLQMKLKHVKYNPYKHSEFQCCEKDIKHSSYTYFTQGRQCYSLGVRR